MEILRVWWRRIAHGIVGNINYAHDKDLPFYDHSQPLLRRSVLRYSLAIFISVAIVAFKLSLEIGFGTGAPFLLLPLAPILSALWGGLGPGVVATLITAFAAEYFQSPNHFGTPRPAQIVELLIYIVAGFFISAVIAERNRAQVRTEYQRKWLGVMLASIGDAVIAADIDGTISYINKVGQTLLGKPAQDIIGKKLNQTLKIVEEKTHHPIDDPIKKVLQKRDIVNFSENVLLVSSSGEEIPIDDSAAPIRDEKGELKGIVMVFRDVSERRRSEKELAKLTWQLDYQIQRLNNVISNVPGVVWEARGEQDEQGQTINFVSSFVEKLLGYSPQDWVSTPNFWLTVIVPEDQAAAGQDFARIMKEGGEGVVEFRCLKKDGNIIWVRSQVMTIKDGQNRTIGLRGVSMDITPLKELEHRKDQFIGMASHELKTPITTIKVFAQMLEKTLREAKLVAVVPLAHKMNDQIDRLTHLVSDLLDISRIQSGKLTFNNETFAIDDLLEEVVANMLEISKRNKIVISGKSRIKVNGDRDRLGQVVINFLTNAIKYSPPGGKIIVGSQKVASGVRVSVQDFGIGISKEAQSKVFERFFQADEPVEKTFPGLGIGLYIASEIVRRHEGKIGLTSQKGKGSTFYFTVPAVKDKPNGRKK